MKKSQFYILAGVLVLITSCWAYVTEPWIKEIWVTTTRDAISSPDFGVPIVSKNNEGYYLNIQPTQAPFPLEAGVIYRGAKHGKIVHLTIIDKNQTIKFDITNFENSHMQVRFDTKQKALDLANRLHFK